MVAQLEFAPAVALDAVSAPVASEAPARTAKPRVVVHLTPAMVHEPDPSPADALTKARVVERIIEMNPTASEQFLRVFSHRRLMDYMEHLVSASEPRGKHSTWLRRGDSPAIVAREPRDE